MLSSKWGLCYLVQYKTMAHTGKPHPPTGSVFLVVQTNNAVDRHGNFRPWKSEEVLLRDKEKSIRTPLHFRPIESLRFIPCEIMEDLVIRTSAY